MHLIEFKICVIVGNGSRVVVTHQIFYSFASKLFFFTGSCVFSMQSCTLRSSCVGQYFIVTIQQNILKNRFVDKCGFVHTLIKTSVYVL